ncbi:hypothetical protein Tco_0024991 [Tanacetum coccineum]
MSTLAEFMIVVGADNRPPMLDKPQYESWKSRMELYIQGKDHGRIILNSVENGPLVWPIVALENGTVRPKTYEELSDNEKLQADCDLKATNIVLQGLPPDVYALVNHHKVAKDIWDRVKLLMQGTSLSKQELLLIANFHQQPSHFNNYHSQYTTPQYPQQFSPPTQHVYSSPPQPNPYGAPHHPKQYPTTYPTNLSYTQPFVTQNAYPPPTIPQQPQAEFPQIDSGIGVPTFLSGDDPIACMKKAMTFLSALFTPCYPSTNNQLRSSSNSRNQATVQDGRVTVQQVQGRQGQKVIGSGSQGNASGSGGNTSGQVKAEGKELDEEQLAFLTDPGVADGQVAQTITHNAAFQTGDLDAYDSDCDDISSAKAVLMANLSSCDSDVLSEVPYSDTFQNDMMNQSVQELQYSKQTPIVDYLDHEITKLNKLAEDFGKHFVPLQELSTEQMFWLQSSNKNSKEPSTSNTPVKIEVLSELPKVSLVNKSLKKLRFHLDSFDKVVKIRTIPDAITEGSWDFEHTKRVFLTEIIPWLNKFKDFFKEFDKGLIDEITKVQTVLTQMEAVVEQCSVDSVDPFEQILLSLLKLSCVG